MSGKENEQKGMFSVVAVKPEPQEVKLAPLSRSSSWQNAHEPTRVKPEPMDVTFDRGFLASDSAKPDPSIKPEPSTVDAARPTLYTKYSSAGNIPYVPEGALKEGLKMIKVIKEEIQKLKLGSKMREDVWMRELQSLESQGAPTTLIAVCGATGAGKSSILNAVLDDNIVPTSGMRACTAVVTEIAYHAKSAIEADVSFLTETEWRQELAVLLQDLVDEDGSVKRTTDLKSDAGIAWQKVHAVYPSLLQERLAKETVDSIIGRDQNIASILGTTKKIIAKDSKIFAQEIAKYIDSKDQRRGKKKDKDAKKKDKNMRKEDKEAGALWPLIRQVNVRCSSAALSTGAILVDLPGVADANAARNNIAKNYMKKCDCIWILAPITRAVDDKTARDLLGDAFKTQLKMDGNYDGSTITFIASKCDDISCREVIHALNLEDDPELEDIEARIDENTIETREWKNRKETAEASLKLIEKERTRTNHSLSEYEAGLKLLENGQPFIPRLAIKSEGISRGTKRKKSDNFNQSPRKRKRIADSDDDDDSIMSDNDSVEAISDDEDSDNDSETGSNDDNDNDENGPEEVTVDTVKVKIEEYKRIIREGRGRQVQLRKERKEAADRLATLKKGLARLQREKNAFCSLKRSEFSRDVLKEDFRMGLKDLDDAAAEERDPEHFDPTANIRDYEAIDLPVFTCSARDYVRLTGQIQGDGDPTCFSNVKDTGIPELQKWCHGLTISSRKRAARNFLSHLKTFATTVKTYVQGIGDVSGTDRESLQDMWETGPMDHLMEDLDENQGSMDPLEEPFGAFAGRLVDDLYNVERKPVIKKEHRGPRVGVKRRLIKEFTEVVDKCEQELQEIFREELEEKCRVGATHAAEAAVPTADDLAATSHWCTYRATLRRHGTWRRDLNTELITPFTRSIALSWSKVFEGDLFAALDKAAMACVDRLLKDVEESAAPGLKDCCRTQGETCLEEVRVALKKTLDAVRETMSNEQKEASRSLAPHVQDELREGYDRAMLETGIGSVARQKALFHDFVDEHKQLIFDGGAEVLMGRLTRAADAIGEALDAAFELLAEKIEVNLAVLWEGPRNDRQQATARLEVVDAVGRILDQVELWMEAEKMSNY